MRYKLVRTKTFKRSFKKLNLTDGNLEHHLRKLEECGFIEIKKSIISGRVKTIVKITKKGRVAFKNYIYEILQLSKEKDVVY